MYRCLVSCVLLLGLGGCKSIQPFGGPRPEAPVKVHPKEVKKPLIKGLRLLELEQVAPNYYRLKYD